MSSGARLTRSRPPEHPFDPRHIRGGADPIDRGGDLGVLGRDDLGGIRPIDLVPVVGGWVVGGSDHHGRRCPDQLGGERDQRCRCDLGEKDDFDPGARQDSGGVLGEPRLEGRASKPRTTGADGGPPALASKWSASPRLVRITTARFMRFDPGPTSPRIPAVPKVSEPPMARNSASPRPNQQGSAVARG